MGKSSTDSTSQMDYTQKTTFDKASPQEQALMAQFTGLGTAQNQALMQQLQSLGSGASPFALDPASQALVNQMYGSAEQQMNIANKDYADFLSGSRGLRMSDTPISSQAMQRQALGLSDLLSQKANTSLNLGLQGNQYRNAAALGLGSAMPAGSMTALQNLYNQRMASGTQHTFGTNTSHSTATPSTMSQIGQGIGLAGQLGAMAMPFLAPGVGSLGMGSGAAANSGFGPSGAGFNASMFGR